MTQRIHIISYFSLPTDLAGEMKDWPEFVGGEHYSVELRDDRTDESVSIRYVEDPDDFDFDYVEVVSNRPGQLFDRALGRAVASLSIHTDHLMVHKLLKH